MFVLQPTWTHTKLTAHVAIHRCLVALVEVGEHLEVIGGLRWLDLIELLFFGSGAVICHEIGTELGWNHHDGSDDEHGYAQADEYDDGKKDHQF